jgi:hypothetical protein
MIAAIVLGVLVTLSAISLMVREVLLGPDTPNYPSAPFYVRLPMFVWMVALAYRAMEIFTLLALGSVPEVSWGMLGASVTMSAYLVANAVYTARLRMRPSTWRRFNRAISLAQCCPPKAGEALTILSLDGWTVAAPGELPDDVPGLSDPNSHMVH